MQIRISSCEVRCTSGSSYRSNSLFAIIIFTTCCFTALCMWNVCPWHLPSIEQLYGCRISTYIASKQHNWTPVNHMALKSSKTKCMHVSTWQRKDNVFPVSNRIHWRSNQWTGNLTQSTGGDHWDWFVMVWAFYLIRQASITITSTVKYYPFQ